MPAFGYRREPPDLDADPEATARAFEAQGVAIAAACARRQLELTAMYSERSFPEPGTGSAHWLALIRDAAALAAAERPAVIVLPSLRILGERARDRLVRALQAAATGATVLLASDERLTDAMQAAWNDRDEADRHAERVREGMQRRALRGYALGRPPYGYRVLDHRLEIDPTEAALVRELAHLYLDGGLGVRRLAALLNDRGLVTRQGRPWSATAVRDILRNPSYLGTSRRLGVIVSAAHEPILDRPLFEAIQRRMSERRTAPSEQQRREYLLSGIGRCGYCGNRLIGVRRPGADHELVYYQCESATNQGRCGYHSRRADDLESEVRARLANVAGELALPPDDDAKEIERLETRRRGLHREIDRGLAAWTSGQWSTSRLVAEAGPPALADLDVEAALEELAARPARAPMVAGDVARQLLEEWGGLTFEEQRALIRGLVSEVVVTDDDVRLRLSLSA